MNYLVPWFLFLLTLVTSHVSVTAQPNPTVDGSLFDSLPPDNNAINANDPRFGLVGDGIHDDSLALLRALNATYYDPGHPNATVPGSRILFLEGNGKIYRITQTIDLHIWQRMIGYGTVRPILYLPPFTFTNLSSITPLLRANCYAPGAYTPPNSTDGNNIAFGIGLINVDIRIAPGNIGATALRWRVAQGGLVRSVHIQLADDTFSGIYFPGWAHQDIVITGGKYGIYIGDSGAWPSSYRDMDLVNQSIAAIAQANYNGPPFPFPAGDWEGSVFTRINIQNTMYGFLSLPAYGGDASQPLYASPVRCIWRNVRWSNVSTALVSLSNFSTFQPAAFTIMDAQGDISPTMEYIFVDNEANSNGTYNIPINASTVSSSSSFISIPWFHAGYDVPNLQRSFLSPAVSTGIHANFTFNYTIVPSDTVSSLPLRDIASYPNVSVSSYLVANASVGIVGDGTTDVTEPLNKLLNLSAVSNVPVYLPTGIYMVSSPILVPPNAVLFGLHCFDTVIRLFDSASSMYKDISSPYPIVHVLPNNDTPERNKNQPSTVQLRIGGLNIQSASGNYTTDQPYPVPAGWTNPNPGAIGLLWESGGSIPLPFPSSSPLIPSSIPSQGLFDVFFHPATFPDNHRTGIGNNTEYSLYINGTNASGSFVDIWTCNAYASSGTMVVDSQGPGIFYQLSNEHHYGHEVKLLNAANWQIWTMQTEDRMDDCSQTIPLNLLDCRNITVGQLQTNRDGNVTTGAAIVIKNTYNVNSKKDNDNHSVNYNVVNDPANILAFHLHIYVWNYHNRTPINFNASVCDSFSGNCAVDVDVGFVGDGAWFGN